MELKILKNKEQSNKIERKKLDKNSSENKQYISSIREDETDFKNSSLGMITFSLLLGFIEGLIVWTLLMCSTQLTTIIWDNINILLPYIWAPLIICPIGGLIIGLFIKYTGIEIDTLESVMEKMEKNGKYKIKKPIPTAILFLLPILFGGSIGPEAGLTGILVSICTKISESLKKMGVRIAKLPEITVSATLSAIFATPFVGIVSGEETLTRNEINYDKTKGEYINIDDYAFRKNVKLVLYTAAAIGSLGAVILLKSIFTGGHGLPHFEVIDLSMIEIGLIIPCLIIGYSGALIFYYGEYQFSKLSKYFKDKVILKPIIAGILLGLIATALPLTLFSGEMNIYSVMENWQSIAAISLILTGLLKCILTPICINFSWRGGHFFPCIFAGVSLGYGIAALCGANPIFCVVITTGTLIAAIQRKPLIAIALLLLCFPIRSILWIGLACLIGSAIPIPKKFLNHAK